MDNESRTLNKTGEWGEIYVNRYVRKKGFDVIAANYNCRFGEADIICLDKKTLVFVEVKSRSGKMIAEPREYVGEQKQRKLILTASYFLRHSKLNLPVRFDVAEVYFKDVNNYKNYKINYIEDAFRV